MGWKRQYYRLLQDSLFQFTSHDSKTPTDEVTLMGMESHRQPFTKAAAADTRVTSTTQATAPKMLFPSYLRVPLCMVLSRVCCLYGFSFHGGSTQGGVVKSVLLSIRAPLDPCSSRSVLLSIRAPLDPCSSRRRASR